MVKGKVSELGNPIKLTDFGEFYDLMYTPKLSRGTEVVDLRVWKLWNTDHIKHPGKNGIMMELSKFREILPKLTALLSDKSKSLKG